MKRIEERFWERVDVRGQDECWLWKGAIGYGRLAVGTRNLLAHRISYELATGINPGELDVLHRCDNPPCVNPAHLFLGTDLDNKHDSMQKGRARVASGKSHGSHTHPERVARGDRHGAHTHPESVARGEDHGFAKLSDESVKTIRSLSDSGISNAELAREYGVSQATISLVVRRLRWTHV